MEDLIHELLPQHLEQQLPPLPGMEQVGIRLQTGHTLHRLQVLVNTNVKLDTTIMEARVYKQQREITHQLPEQRLKHNVLQDTIVLPEVPLQPKIFVLLIPTVLQEVPLQLHVEEV